jgi:hypothetical protein
LVNVIRDNLNVSRAELWQDFSLKLPNFTHIEIPKHLKQIEYMPLTRLVDTLADLREDKKVKHSTSSWLYVAIILGSLLLLGVAMFVFCRYVRLGKFKGCIGNAKFGTLGVKKEPSYAVTYNRANEMSSIVKSAPPITDKIAEEYIALYPSLKADNTKNSE